MQKNKAIQIRAITEIALCSALIAASAMISIPFPVPFTLQILGVVYKQKMLRGAAVAQPVDEEIIDL